MRLSVSSRELSFAVGCLLLGALLWVLGHPYVGIWHDARLYLLAAAHWLSPESYARDLFFVFGSQDDYTLFSPLYGSLIKLVGGSRAAIIVVLSGAALWLAAHYLLARTALGTNFWAALFVLLGGMLSISYSPNGSVFVLNEKFATSRSLAMPMGLLSIWLSVNGKQRWGLFTALLAMAIHPLSGIWAVLLQFAGWLSLRGLLLAAVFGLLAMICIAIADLPVARLQRMSTDWLAAIGSSQSDVLLAAPGRSRLGVYLLCIAALLFGARFGNTMLRPTYARIGIIAIGGLCATILTSYLFPIALFVQVQFWRVFWLAMPLAILAAFDGISQTWRSRSWLSVGVWVVLIALYVLLPLKVLAPLLVVGAALSYLRWFSSLANRLLLVLQPYSNLLRWSMLVAVALMLPVVVEDLSNYGGHFFDLDWRGVDWLGGTFAATIWLVPLVGAALLGGRRVGHWLLICGCLAMVPWVTARWDQRPAIQRADEPCYLSTQCGPHLYAAQIKRGETVYWKDRELRVPFLLNTASYVNSINLAGRVFSEQKFREFSRREKNVSDAEARGAPDLACRDGELDWVITKQPASAGNGPDKQSTSASHRAMPDRLIDCRRWRKTNLPQVLPATR